MSNNNPYSKAASTYGDAALETDQRTMEGTILQRSAQKIEDLAKRLQNGEKVSFEEVGATLDHNQKLWQLFVSDISSPDHHLPLDLRNNVASLAVFIFKRTQDILIDPQPEKFKALVNINRSIAAGLLKKTAEAPAAGTPAHRTQITETV